MAWELAASSAEIFAISLALMVAAVALIYMLAQFMKRPEWEAYANLELYQVFISAVMLIGILFTVNLAIETSLQIYGQDYFQIANEYLESVILKLTVPTLVQMEGIVLWSQWIGGIQMHYGAGSAWSYRFPLFPWSSLVESVFELLFFLISPFTASIMAQYYGLQIIKSVMLPLVLPAGIVLRTFPQTRDAGVFLIATALGFYFVFPLTYVMHYNVMKEVDKKDKVMDFLTEENNPDADDFASGAEPIDPNVPRDSQFDRIWGKVAFDWKIIFTMFSKLSTIIIQAIFLPGFSLMLTVTFIKSAMKFIGQKMG